MAVAGLVNIRRRPRRYRFGGSVGRFQGGGEVPTVSVGDTNIIPQTYGTWSELGQSGEAPWVGTYASGDPGIGPATYAPPPELARYFGANGSPRIDDPRKVAAEGGITLGQLAGGFFPRVKNEFQGYEFPSDQGGFFTVEDLFNLTGRPAPAPGVGGRGAGENLQDAREGKIPVPQIGTFGMSGPSTNNWRLLGRGPGWIMRNNELINTKSAGGRMGGPAYWTPSGGNSGEQWIPAFPTALGAGAWAGVPNMLQAGLGQPTTFGWPGAEHWWPGGALST